MITKWTENMLLQTPTTGSSSFVHITMPLLASSVLKVSSSTNLVKHVSGRVKIATYHKQPQQLQQQQLKLHHQLQLRQQLKPHHRQQLQQQLLSQQQPNQRQIVSLYSRFSNTFLKKYDYWQ